MENVPGAVDRRQARRYRVALPIELEHGTGLTRDISACGVFFATDASFPVGVTISLSLVLEYADLDGPVRLPCQGEVVRVERYEGNVGVAVRFTAYWFDLQGQGYPSLGQSAVFPDFVSSPAFRQDGLGAGRRKLREDG
ncbi:MAG: PilZ domain-containing protein [Deltaproteobacteria bacterium]|nr:PilZ domain-containing protein [Deltaproteobacteria bacterium]